MNSPLVLRSSRSPYIVFGVIIGPIFLLYVVLAFISPNIWQGVLASGILLGAIFGYLASVRLVVTDDRIMYRDWLRSREMVLDDVKRYRIATGFAFDKRNHMLPFRRLVLEPRKSSDQSTVYMNLATLNPVGVKKLIETLNHRGIERH